MFCLFDFTTTSLSPLVPATPLSAPHSLTTLWQRHSPRSHAESEELGVRHAESEKLSVREDQQQQRGKLEAGKGWTVTVSASRELLDQGAPVQNSLPQVPQLVVASARTTTSHLSTKMEPLSSLEQAQITYLTVPKKSSPKSQRKLVRSGPREKKAGSFSERVRSRERHGQRMVHTQKKLSGRHQSLNSRGSVMPEGRKKKESKR